MNLVGCFGGFPCFMFEGLMACLDFYLQCESLGTWLVVLEVFPVFGLRV